MITRKTDASKETLKLMLILVSVIGTMYSALEYFGVNKEYLHDIIGFVFFLFLFGKLSRDQNKMRSEIDARADQIMEEIKHNLININIVKLGDIYQRFSNVDIISDRLTIIEIAELRKFVNKHDLNGNLKLMLEELESKTKLK